MHDYLFTSEVVRFAFVFGVATSMLLYERRHLTTGSIVVPGYVATFAVYPMILVATAVNAGLSYLIVNKVLNRWFLLYGRTKFTVLALISIAIQTAMLKLSPSGAWLWESDIKLVVGVGYVVPALIAHDMGRQGVVKTIRSVSIASVIVLIPIGIALWIDLPGINDLAPLTGVGRMAIDAPWIPVAVLLSAAAAWGVSHNYGFRSGGFMGASFIAILLGDPWQVAVAIALAMATYLFVTRMLMNEMILFGRRKFSAMLLVSATTSWVLLWTGDEVLGIEALQHVDVGALALTPLIVPGLVANDAQRTGPSRVLAGLALATVFVLCTTWWAQSIVQQSHLQLGWKVLSLLSFCCIFWPQLSPNRFAVRTGDAEVVLAPAVPLVSEPGPMFGFSINGYRGWAELHRSAAAAADSWLSTLVGPTLQPAIVTSAPSPVPATAPSDRGPGAHRIAQWRAAAHGALGRDRVSPSSVRRHAPHRAPHRAPTRPVARPATQHRANSSTRSVPGARSLRPSPPVRSEPPAPEQIARWRAAAKRSLAGDPERSTAIPPAAPAGRPTSVAEAIGRWRSAAERVLESDRSGGDAMRIDRVAAALPRRQATDGSLAPTGPMIGAASLVSKHPSVPTADAAGTPTGARPAARVLPSSTPGGETMPPVVVALPRDDANIEAMDDDDAAHESPTR